MMKYQDQIHETTERMHRCYDKVVELLLQHRSHRGPGFEIMIEMHNEASIGMAADIMSKLGIAPNNICARFAQLYGMSDNLMSALGKTATANSNTFPIARSVMWCHIL